MYNLKHIFMKKFYSLVAVLAVSAMAANAQITYPHTWDFTKWSDETVANLKAVNAANETWSDIEKVDGTEPTETSKDNCFWQVSVEKTVVDGVLMANNVAIEETKGLKFIVEKGGNPNNRSLAIAVNYPTALNDYEGPSYLWLGGKGVDYFTIPAVPGGATIKMGIESHKNTAARGVKLFVNGTAIDGPAAPTTYQQQTWTIPAGDAVDVTVQNTDGCHIYYVAVGDGAKVPEVGGVETITIAEDENAPIYNLQGVQVDENYKGVVIKNGKKYINR